MVAESPTGKGATSRRRQDPGEQAMKICSGGKEGARQRGVLLGTGELVTRVETGDGGSAYGGAVAGGEGATGGPAWKCGCDERPSV